MGILKKDKPADRSIGSGAAAADAAVEGRPHMDDHRAEAPHARPARPLRLAPAPVWRHALVLVLPVTTTMVAAGLWHLAGPLPSNLPIALGSGLVALVLWATLLGRAYRSATSASPRSSAPS